MKGRGVMPAPAEDAACVLDDSQAASSRTDAMADALFRDLGPHETLLVGQWLDVGSGIVGDAVEDRIKWLTATRLLAQGVASDGWDWLFRDPRDGRFWELTFPFGSLHGSGPRQLAVVSADVAQAKYGIGAG